MGYRVINGRAHAVGNFNSIENCVSTNVKTRTTNFNDILNNLQNKDRGYVLSKHAAERLKEINFNDEDMKNIAEGFSMAEDKGSKNSVMIYKDVALIASIENRTLITAIEKERAESNVFTNIDSVVIL